MEFSRQEYWSGLPFPSPGDLLDPGKGPREGTQVSYAAGRFFTNWDTSKQVTKQWIFSLDKDEIQWLNIQVVAVLSCQETDMQSS